MLSTFILTVFAWIFFRAENVSHALSYITGIFSKSLFSISISEIKNISYNNDIIFHVLLIISFIFFEWVQRNKKHGLHLEESENRNKYLWVLYYFLILIIIIFQGGAQDFIYFQF